MTWSYTKTFTGTDSLMYRIRLDEEIGNNDSFINAWEILKMDKTMRERLQSSLGNELDVRIITLNLTKNESIKVQVSGVNVTNATLPKSKDGTMTEMLSKICQYFQVPFSINMHSAQRFFLQNCFPYSTMRAWNSLYRGTSCGSVSSKINCSFM
jgi:hypothetical protein